MMSSPIFLGERPRGPTLGAREEVAPISPPTTRNLITRISLGSNLGGMVFGFVTVYEVERCSNTLSHLSS